MQRIVSINLSGNAYQLEEQGYTALFAYLDAADAALRNSPERAQTLDDLERAAAEKCQACLGPHKTVVTTAEIDRIILELGPVPGTPAAEPAASSSSTSSKTSDTTSPNHSSPNPSSHRRLFQIRDGAMISGVCLGLSEYLHIDVTIIRILFVVFALASSGWGILAYGVLMFVLPRVETRAEAAGGTATGTMPPHHWPWDAHSWPWERPAGQGQARQDSHDARQASRDARQAARDARRDWRDERRAARLAHPPHPFGTFTMIMFLMIGFFWLSFWTRGHFFFGWPFVWGFPHWIGIVFFFIMLRLIFMPFRAARWYGYGPYGHTHYAWVSMWNGLMWFAVMIFLIWAAYSYIPDVHDFIRSFQAGYTGGYRL